MCAMESEVSVQQRTSGGGEAGVDGKGHDRRVGALAVGQRVTTQTKGVKGDDDRRGRGWPL